MNLSTASVAAVSKPRPAVAAVSKTRAAAAAAAEAGDNKALDRSTTYTLPQARRGLEGKEETLGGDGGDAHIHSCIHLNEDERRIERNRLEANTLRPPPESVLRDPPAG
jgi:hypothetical protein